MISVQLYVKADFEISGQRFERVSMFKDEVISLTSTIQNINDISKVYTDFTQTFNVPADDINNRIFKHWYNNFIDGGFDARLRVDAILYVDTKVFRIGLIELEKVNLTDNLPGSYAITFFGKLVSLKDKIKEDKLNTLTYINDEYAIDYSANNVIDLVQNNVDNDVMFPLISSKRNWSYGDALATDIATSTGAINSNELFPALRVKAVFNAIGVKYNISFVSDFFNTEQFTKLFLHLKNKELFNFASNELPIEFQSITGEALYFDFNLDGSATFNGISQPYPTTASLGVNILQTTGTFKIKVFRGGVLFITFDGIGQATMQTFNVFVNYESDPFLYAGEYTFSISSSVSNDIQIVGTTVYEVDLGFPITEVVSAQAISSFLGIIDLLAYMPDMKISDFISGILKMFNLTIYSYEENIYYIETLENFYLNGTDRDLTPYIENKFDVNRVKSFNKISFKYVKSESYMNALFYQNNNIEYGELQSTFQYDGGEYKVDIPFENILHNRFTGTDLQVSYYVKTDYITSIVPKAPVLLYLYGNVDISATPIVMKDNLGGFATVESYNAFGQDITDTGINYTLNFGYQNSTLLNVPIENSLYHEYYLNYLLNIYNIKSRIVTIKAKLPISTVLNLRLNDRIIIAQKAYLINSFTIDLITGITQLDLLTDFRIAQ